MIFFIIIFIDNTFDQNESNYRKKKTEKEVTKKKQGLENKTKKRKRNLKERSSKWTEDVIYILTWYIESHLPVI